MSTLPAPRAALVGKTWDSRKEAKQAAHDAFPLGRDFNERVENAEMLHEQAGFPSWSPDDWRLVAPAVEAHHAGAEGPRRMLTRLPDGVSLEQSDWRPRPGGLTGHETQNPMNPHPQARHLSIIPRMDPAHAIVQAAPTGRPSRHAAERAKEGISTYFHHQEPPLKRGRATRGDASASKVGGHARMTAALRTLSL